jgi:DNA-binding LytR/AlgR family response regulator
MLRVVLIEDEQHSRERLRRLLAPFDDVEIVGEAADGLSAVALIDQCRPDLALIDVQLPELSGFDVLARARYRPLVIFVTAFDHYAVRAFEEQALDYLLKPTAPERLAAAIARVRQAKRPLDDAVLATLRELVERRAYADQLSVRRGDSIVLVSVAQVLWFESEDRYVLIHTATQEHVSDLTLKQLEEQLDPARFLRIHRSVIVATSQIAKIERSFGGRYGVRLREPEGRRFEIGRAHLPAVRSRLRF